MSIYIYIDRERERDLYIYIYIYIHVIQTVACAPSSGPAASRPATCPCQVAAPGTIICDRLAICILQVAICILQVVAGTIFVTGWLYVLFVTHQVAVPGILFAAPARLLRLVRSVSIISIFEFSI